MFLVFLLLAIFLELSYIYWPKDNAHNNSREHSDGTIPISGDLIICDEDLENLSFNEEYSILIVGYDGCAPCDSIKKEFQLPINVSASAFYLDIVHSGKHLLIAQALRTMGFPTIYIINQNYVIIGIIPGLKDWDAKLNSVVNGGTKIIEYDMEGNNTDQLSLMLGFSLRSLLASFDNNEVSRRQYVRLSLEHGSYFFNNWLLYRFYLDENNVDSAQYYKNLTLNFASGVDLFVYEDIIEDMNER